MQWMENGLYSEVEKLNLFNFPGEAYNAVYHIQRLIFRDTLPLLRSDTVKALDVIFKMRTSSRPLPD